MSEKLYPLGTVVYLKEGTEKLMVIGRGVVYQDQETNSEMFVDYMDFNQIIRIKPNNTIFFNQENIDRVVFKGFVDEEEERFIEIYQNWEKSLTIPKKKID